MNECVWSRSTHFISSVEISLLKNGEPNPCQIQQWQCVSARVPYWMLAAAAAHCLSFTCGKLIATSIMLLNEFVYPAQFTKMMGEMLHPLSSKLITLSLNNTTKQWWICLNEKVDKSLCPLFDWQSHRLTIMFCLLPIQFSWVRSFHSHMSACVYMCIYISVFLTYYQSLLVCECACFWWTLWHFVLRTLLLLYECVRVFILTCSAKRFERSIESKSATRMQCIHHLSYCIPQCWSALFVHGGATWIQAVYYQLRASFDIILVFGTRILLWLNHVWLHKSNKAAVWSIFFHHPV